MRKLLLFAVTAVAALAFAAPAMATEAVMVVNEDTGQPCTLATCEAHVVNEGHIELTGHIFGFPVHQLDCNNEYTLNVDANGEGEISNFNFTEGNPEDSGCADVVPCDGSPWPFHGEENPAVENQGVLTVDLCIQATVDCDGALTIQLNELAEHAYEGSVNDQPVSGTICEISGHWLTESANFDIVHAPDA